MVCGGVCICGFGGGCFLVGIFNLWDDCLVGFRFVYRLCSFYWFGCRWLCCDVGGEG